MDPRTDEADDMEAVSATGPADIGPEMTGVALRSGTEEMLPRLRKPAVRECRKPPDRDSGMPVSVRVMASGVGRDTTLFLADDCSVGSLTADVGIENSKLLLGGGLEVGATSLLEASSRCSLTNRS